MKKLLQQQLPQQQLPKTYVRKLLPFQQQIKQQNIYFLYVSMYITDMFFILME